MIPIISIVLALGLPAFALSKVGKAPSLKRPYLFSVGSFAFCALGMLTELYTVRRRLLAGDIGGIEDTIDAVILICIALALLTVVLNLLLLGLSYGPGEKE